MRGLRSRFYDVRHSVTFVNNHDTFRRANGLHLYIRSNMAYAFSRSQAAQEETSAADRPRIRLFRAAQRETAEPAELLLHGQEIGENLRRVVFVGQTVVDGHAGVRRQVADRLLGEAAVLDGVVHAPEHPRRVLDRFLLADVRSRGVQVGDVGALVVGRRLEGTTGAGRGLLEEPHSPRQLGGVRAGSPLSECGRGTVAGSLPAEEDADRVLAAR